MIFNCFPLSGSLWEKKQKPSPPTGSCFSSTLHATPGDTEGSHRTDTMGQRTMTDGKALTKTQLRELSLVLFYSLFSIDQFLTRKMSAYPAKDSTPSWIRAPPESFSPITGAPTVMAWSIIWDSRETFIRQLILLSKTAFTKYQCFLENVLSTHFTM